MIKIPVLILIMACTLRNAAAQDTSGYNCFTILVGRNASADGSVFIAHNEDNPGDAFVDLHKVPRIRHAPGEMQEFAFHSDSIEEAAETNGYLWISSSNYNAEQYINEWGVAVTSNASGSKIDGTPGRIEHNLRRLIAERAHSAREAVLIAGSLIERYGYAASGRIYSFADPDEAWVLEVARGEHWLARRVPDDEVVLVPNYYVIDSFDTADTVNCLSTPGIVEFAVKNGWTTPDTGRPFNFRKAYGFPARLDAISNIARKWIALVILSPKWYRFYSDFPFSFKPRKKIAVQDLMRILENHYEGTEFEMHPSYARGCPHSNTAITRICNSRTDFGSVIQLRKRLPAGVGNVMWVAPRNPCCQPFTTRTTSSTPSCCRRTAVMPGQSDPSADGKGLSKRTCSGRRRRVRRK
jgi:dipeptidase